MSELHHLYEEIPQRTTPMSVSELNRNSKAIIEEYFPNVFVTGEISNCMRPRSGHYYFSLKDSSAQISCAMFKGYQECLKVPLEDGMQVNIRGKLSIYPERGNYQLIAAYLETSGDGKLKEKFEELKNKLKEEGLFSQELKKEIPKIPKTIGVITSTTGAAIQDILKVLKERYNYCDIIVYPSLVQGTEAKYELVRALQKANERNECDVLILARGGGSYEDLWPFNEEIVAREIVETKIPIISGIGHEIDFTIADYVADIRAATPSQAALLATPDQNELIQNIDKTWQQLHHVLRRILDRNYLILENSTKSLQHPLQKIYTWSQMLDNHDTNLHHNWQRYFKNQQSSLQQIMTKIETLSPMKTLQRGYSIASHKSKAIASVKEIDIGSELDIKFKDGSILARVLKKWKD